jgi:asparagine synthase (glutamine-hydrolysing)
LRSELGAAATDTDAAMVAQAWLRWGHDCVEKLQGDYVFALCPPDGNELVLVRDRIGVKPLFYRVDGEKISFGTSAAAVIAISSGPLNRNEAWMARFLVQRSASHTETAYREIFKLPAAHILRFSRDGQLRLSRYHRFVDDAPWQDRRDPIYLDAYRANWQTAISDRLPEAGAVGCENSGGLDSGSITAEVARQLGKDSDRLHAYGFCREAREPEAIMAVAMQYGIRHTRLCSSPYHSDIQSGRLNDACRTFGYPIEASVALEHELVMDWCVSDGVGTLYSGLGGDHCVTQESFVLLDELGRYGKLPDLYRMAPGSPIRRLYRALKQKFGGYRIPAMDQQSLDRYQARWQYSFFTPEAEHEFGLYDTFVGASDLPLEKPGINDMALDELASNYLPVRLENCSVLAAAHGVDYVWPMLDARLIQSWLSSPTVWKLGDGWFWRYLHRCAINGVCPDTVAWAPQKDMGGQHFIEYYGRFDNRPSFKRLLDLTADLPPALVGIVDANKLRVVAELGLRNDPRNYEAFSATLMFTNTLPAMLHWLQSGQTKPVNVTG